MDEKSPVILRYSEGSGPCVGERRSFGVPQDDSERSNSHHDRRVPLVSCLALVCGVLSLALGCADDHPQPTSHPGDALLKDPFGYKPTFDDPNISGGDIGHFDKKAFKKDWDSVINP